MTKPVARRVIAGGCNARVFSQTTPTNLKSHTPRAGANHGAGLFYRNIPSAHARLAAFFWPPGSPFGCDY
jgi:hypothetical protein